MQELDISLPIEIIPEDYVSCGICFKECSFLQEYGSPQDLARDWLADSGKNEQKKSF